VILILPGFPEEIKREIKITIKKIKNRAHIA